VTAEARPLQLTRFDRWHLAEGKFTAAVRAKLPHLWLP
jgi:hypothetical protein